MFINMLLARRTSLPFLFLVYDTIDKLQYNFHAINVSLALSVDYKQLKQPTSSSSLALRRYSIQKDETKGEKSNDE